MNRKSTIAIVTAISLFASVAAADMVTYNGVGLNEIVRIHSPGSLADNLKVSAGQTSVTYHGQNYITYCVDINHYAGSGQVVQTSTASLHNGDIVAYLLHEFAAGATTDRKAAALGVAIWEAVFETSGVFNTGVGHANRGSFYVDSTPVAKDANDLLNTWHGQITPNYIVLDGLTVQDFVVVPEPATLVLLGLGGVGAMLRRRR